MTTRRKPQPHPTITDPTRKTPTQVLGDIALAQAERRFDPNSKVEISRNARGDFQFSVEVGHRDPFEAAQIARDIAAVLAAEYPRAEA